MILGTIALIVGFVLTAIAWRQLTRMLASIEKMERMLEDKP